MDLSFPSIKRSIDPIIYGGIKGCVKRVSQETQAQRIGFMVAGTYTPLGPLLIEGKRCSHGDHFWGLPPALCSHGVSLLGNLVFLETSKSDPR